MTDAEKRARVEAELATDPSRSDRAIARAVGASPTLVGKVRKVSTSPSTVSTPLSANVDTPATVSTVSTSTMDAEVARLTEQVGELARRLDALEGRAAAPMDAFGTSAPAMDSAAAYKIVSKLFPLLKSKHRGLLRDRLRAWR